MPEIRWEEQQLVGPWFKCWLEFHHRKGKIIFNIIIERIFGIVETTQHVKRYLNSRSEIKKISSTFAA